MILRQREQLADLEREVALLRPVSSAYHSEAQSCVRGGLDAFGARDEALLIVISK